MLTTRIIPCLLLQGQGLVKTIKYKHPRYIGDPINAVKIFNEREVDEIIFLDIDAGKKDQQIQYKLLEEIASECFIPFCYGGGIKTVKDARRIFKLGAEKIAINTIALDNPNLIKALSDEFGAQSIVVSIDVKKDLWGKNKVCSKSGTKKYNIDPINFAKKVESLGAGEIMLNSIDGEGTMQGFDIELVKKVVQIVDIPVIACGGAGSLKDIRDVVKKTKVSAVAAGSIFVYFGRQNGILINYPDRKEIEKLLK